jgi:hypothetical protein
MNLKDVMDQADAAARFASALKAAIALGNGQEREMELSSELFD